MLGKYLLLSIITMVPQTYQASPDSSQMSVEVGSKTACDVLAQTLIPHPDSSIDGVRIVTERIARDSMDVVTVTKTVICKPYGDQ